MKIKQAFFNYSCEMCHTSLPIGTDYIQIEDVKSKYCTNRLCLVCFGLYLNTNHYKQPEHPKKVVKIVKRVNQVSLN